MRGRPDGERNKEVEMGPEEVRKVVGRLALGSLIAAAAMGGCAARSGPACTTLQAGQKEAAQPVLPTSG
ncbi:MAG TPA: hypothetical protein VNX25_06930 [Verrucomicrobiae bacterium]|nr:hypothetical protein [Verrucomicrobiae bacterium]